MKKTLTEQILTATLGTRPIYGGSDGTRKTIASRGQHLSGMFASYVEASNDFSEVYAHYLITGERTVPVSLVRHYADGTSCCPKQLYIDIKTYLDSASIPHSARQQLWDDLHRILDEVPTVDSEAMLHAANVCRENGIYALLTAMLYYAWRIDLAGYTYLVA